MKLLLIESAGKLAKLKSILGSGWIIKATMGHVVELANSGEDSLGFTIDPQRNCINCDYVPRGVRGKKILAELRSSIERAEIVLLATDPDREGETIAWHLAQQLRLKNPQRITYTEITEKAVKSAIARPRPIDQNLAAAGRCRDTLDKWVGFKVSPLLWNLHNGARSAGRVQSASLHILCQREREIKAFAGQDYWSVFVDYAEGFRACYAGTEIGGADSTLVESNVGDDAVNAKEKQTESLRVSSQRQAEELIAVARSHPHQVAQVENTSTTRLPPAPFTTSSLQQAAGSRLKYGSEQTMKIAQSLYERGKITYMRTDSVHLSEDYCAAARKYLQKHDPENVPHSTAKHKSKLGAQEAHEAIRPTDVGHIPHLETQLSNEELRLYDLIWRRSIASQCQNARLQKTRIVTRSLVTYWQARGQVVIFPGYTRYWDDLSADMGLPVLQQRQQLTLKQAAFERKQTQPAPRYSEHSLVQTMERRGIGRPSTYSPTIKVLRERGYVGVLRGNLQPTQLGMEVDEFLLKVLPDLIQPEFTAQMEAQLDAIADGFQNWERYLIDWNQSYFAPALNSAYRALGINSSPANRNSKQFELTQIHCPKCDRMMQIVPCRSKKLQTDHFLKCSNPSCDTAMFWSDKKQGYELPYATSSRSIQKDNLTIVAAENSMPPSQTHAQTSFKSAPASSNITDYSCPVCGQFLEVYDYLKENQPKRMLRCSDDRARQRADHKDVAFFMSRGVFWSRKYGEVRNNSTQNR